MAAESPFVTILVQLSGFCTDVFRAELARCCMQAHGASLNATKTRSASVEHSEQRYIPPSPDQLRLAIVGAAEEMGAWGYTAPLVLEESTPWHGSSSSSSMHRDKKNGSSLSACEMDNVGESHLSFTARVRVPAASFSPLLRYRLAIVDKPLLCASANGCITPGASIVAVENMRSQPDTVMLVPMETDDSVKSEGKDGDLIKDEERGTGDFLSANGGNNNNNDNNNDSNSSSCAGSGIAAGGHWRAQIDVFGRAMHFARATKQFAFLSQLWKVGDTGGAPRTGPLLSLTLYGNDPRVRYNRSTWIEGLSPQARDAVLYLQQYDDGDDRSGRGGSNPPSLPSSLVDVRDIYPVRSEGCCWCEGHLPTPAPMERQMNAVKQSTQRRNKGQHFLSPRGSDFSFASEAHSISGATSNSSSMHRFNSRAKLPNAALADITTAGSRDPVVTAEMHRGWCVEPLHTANPLRPFTSGDMQFTMRVWHTTVNVSPLRGRGLQVEAMMPLPIYDDGGQKNKNNNYNGTDNNEGYCSNLSNSMHCNNALPSFFSEATTTTAATTTAETSINSMEDPGRRKQKSSGHVEGGSGSSNNSSTTTRAVVGVRWVKGVALLQPALFQHHTSGTVVVPICFNTSPSDGDNGSVQWQSLYVQYLFVFPFQEPERNTLEVVRSRASLGRLATKKLVGHRGLGKTYTRSTPSECQQQQQQQQQDGYSSSSTAGCKTSSRYGTHQLMVKLAENSLEALNAAHRRGCDMVEFDVMLTRDRIPVIFHDPLIQLQARGKRGAGTCNGRVERLPSSTPIPMIGCGGASLPVEGSLTEQRRQTSPFLMFTPSGVTAAGAADASERYGLYMQALPNFASVPIAMHQLTRRQLDVVITETFSHVKAGNTLRTLILRHWHQILRLYRERHCDQHVHKTTRKPDEEASAEGETRLEDCLSPGGDDDSRNRHSLCGDDCTRLFRKDLRIISQQEDVTNRICTLQDLFEGTPATLRFDLEVKFPFQPIGDSNLFLQTDAFEINAFVDDILRVVFAYAEQSQLVDGEDGQKAERPRDVIFSSFEPDVCLALKLKQSRFDVVFLCETDMCNDFKDYRCFGLVEGALQFSISMGLSGVSIHALSLCLNEQKHIPSTSSGRRLRDPPLQEQPPPLPPQQEQQEQQQIESGALNSVQSSFSGTTGELTARREAMWASFDCRRGKAIVAYAHSHGQLVWTWGELNNDEHFRYLQSRVMGVDAIITDSVPLWSAANVEGGASSVSI